MRLFFLACLLAISTQAESGAYIQPFLAADSSSCRSGCDAPHKVDTPYGGLSQGYAFGDKNQLVFDLTLATSMATAGAYMRHNWKNFSGGVGAGVSSGGVRMARSGDRVGRGESSSGRYWSVELGWANAFVRYINTSNKTKGTTAEAVSSGGQTRYTNYEHHKFSTNQEMVLIGYRYRF